MKALFYRLIIFLNSASEEDTNYNIAWYMAHHFTQIANMGISQLAKECYVSPATISRFCRTLGYENYAHLKQECASFSIYSRKFNNLINIPVDMMHDDPTGSTRLYCQEVAKAINQLPETLDWNTIDRVLELIHDSDSVAFFGTQFSHSVAMHFQTDLLMLEKFTMAYMERDRQLDCAKELTKDSVAIIVSVNGNFASNIKVLSYIHKSGCKVVLLTSRADLNLGFPIDYVINLGSNDEAKIGKHNLLTTIELMSLRYYSIYYPDVKEKIV